MIMNDDDENVFQLITGNKDLPDKEEQESVKTMTEDLDRFVGIGFSKPDPETGEEAIIFFGRKTNTLEAFWLASELTDYIKNNY